MYGIHFTFPFLLIDSVLIILFLEFWYLKAGFINLFESWLFRNDDILIIQECSQTLLVVWPVAAIWGRHWGNKIVVYTYIHEFIHVSSTSCAISIDASRQMKSWLLHDTVDCLPNLQLYLHCFAWQQSQDLIMLVSLLRQYMMSLSPL